jgi:RNA ligase
MTHISDVISPDLLRDEIDAGYIKVNRHPTLPLSIYTYTRACQYEGRWNDATRACRGLIVDDDGTVVARPFVKFLNVGEFGTRDYAPASLPVEPFEVYEKLDGSLGIIFCYDSKWHAASKGSFVSEQAQWAQAWLNKYRMNAAVLDPDLTYCAEIVYPSNRIVVDYGDRRDLVLLAAFKTDGTEVDLRSLRDRWLLGSTVKTWGWQTALNHLVNVTTDNLDPDYGTPLERGTDIEGFVVRFKSGLRAKIKYAEYVRLHRILTGISERDIWRAVAFDDLRVFPSMTVEQLTRALKCSADDVLAMKSQSDGALAAIVDGCPDEFDAWVKDVTRRLRGEYQQTTLRVMTVFSGVKYAAGTERGAFARCLAEREKDRTVRAACFDRLDDKPIAPVVWRSLYPEAATPFREDDDS